MEQLGKYQIENGLGDPSLTEGKQKTNVMKNPPKKKSGSPPPAPRSKKKKLDYYDAKKEAFNVKWKISTCGQGESCWCRTIVPVTPIKYGKDEEFDCIVHMGAIDKEFAEYLVELHNKKLENENN